MTHTKEEIEATIVEWRNSGLSRKAFCREHKLTYQTFHYWFKRLHVPSASGFEDVKLSGRTHGSSFELIFPSGVRMVFDGQPSAGWIRELVK